MHVHQTLYPFAYADEPVYNSILLTWSCNAAQEVTCSSTGLSSVCNRQRKRMWSRNMGRKCGVWTVLVVTQGICDQTTFVKALCNWAVASSPGPDFLEGAWEHTEQLVFTFSYQVLLILSCHLRYEFRHLTYWVLLVDYENKTKSPSVSIWDTTQNTSIITQQHLFLHGCSWDSTVNRSNFSRN